MWSGGRSVANNLGPLRTSDCELLALLTAFGIGNHGTLVTLGTNDTGIRKRERQKHGTYEFSVASTLHTNGADIKKGVITCGWG
jgi:hypothetical protein